MCPRSATLVVREKKWDRSKGQLSFPRSAKVTGKENNYKCADSASTTQLSRLLDPVTTDKTLVITPFVADDRHAT